MLTLLIVLFTMNGVISTKAAPKVKFSDVENYLEITENLIIAGNVTDEVIYQELDDYLASETEKMIVIYDFNGHIKDIMFDVYSEDAFAFLYYRNAHGTLISKEIRGTDLNETSKNLNLKKFFKKYYKDYTKEKEEKIKQATSNKDINLTQVFSTTSETCDFSIPKYIVSVTDIYEKYSYIVADSHVYRCTVNGIYIFRIENQVQYTSGAAAVESFYNNEYQGYSSSLVGSLEKHVVNGYGTWYSAQPLGTDYWPKNETQYRTITSGFNTSLTLGNTQSTSASASENGFGLSVGSEFSSSLSIGFFYSETWKEEQPTNNSQWLSSSEGAGWGYTNFPNDGTTSITVYPGILLETIPATPYAMRYNGEFHMNYSFVTKNYGLLGITLDTKTQTFEKIILLDITI